METKGSVWSGTGNNRGMALLVTVIVLSVAAVLAVASVSMLVGASKMPSDRAAFTQAYYTARSAESAALLYLENNPSAEGSFGVFDLMSTGNVLRAQYLYSIEDAGGDALFLDIVPGDGSGVEFWHNECSGALSGANATSSHMGGDLKPADLNGSGYYDVVVGDGGDGFAVFTGGESGFSFDAVYLAGNTLKCIAAADINGSGDVDIVLGTGAGMVEVWLNDGAGGFLKDAEYEAGGVLTCISAADVNGENGADIVAGTDAGRIEVWLNDGAGGFQKDAEYEAGGVPSCLAIADINVSGSFDIVLGTGAGAVEVWLNDGTGKFSCNPLEDKYPLESGAVPTCISVADVNGENGADIAAGTDTGRIGVWLNDGAGKFWEPPEEPPEDPPGAPVQNVTYYDLTVGAAVSLVLSDKEYPDIIVGIKGEKIEILQNLAGVIQVSAYYEADYGRARCLPVKKITATAYYPTLDEYNARVRGMPRAERSSVIYAVRPGNKFRVLAGHTGSE